MRTRDMSIISAQQRFCNLKGETNLYHQQISSTGAGETDHNSSVNVMV